MYKLKNVVQRGGAFLGAVGLLAGVTTSALPSLASADALNPLTERSLTLSSSSPGWSFLDGSGNTTYAPPHSGANGQKTGNTFSYRMSTQTATVKAITFQYCTSPAGDCVAPGNNTINPYLNGNATTVTGTGTLDFSSGSATVTGTGTNFDPQISAGTRIVTAGGNVYTVLSRASGNDTSLTLTTTASDDDEDDGAFEYRSADTSSSSDLNVAVGAPGPTAPLEISTGDWDDVSNSTTTPSLTPPADNDTLDEDDRPYMGNFVVLRADANAAPTDWGDYSYSGDWDMAVGNQETGTFATGDATEKNNLITLTSDTGQALSGTLVGTSGDYFKVIFFGTDDNYITNPGAGSFFVRMNTYSSDTLLDDAHLIDGGVTVANVMNESITIQTKVLETMDFSVGTHDPNTYPESLLVTTLGLPALGSCSALLMADPEADGVTNNATYLAQPHNVLQLGDPTAEYSLKTTLAYDVNSYWRLSSNSSGGATVYYTGHTLTNTVGDEIEPLDDTSPGGTLSNTGTEQFGLAIQQAGGPNYLVDGDTYGTSDGNTGTYNGTFADLVANDADDVESHLPRLAPLVPMANYANGAGLLDNSGPTDPAFAFNANADTYAIPIASESTDVVNCVTAKMRYVANIAATTPAGIYTTKINYVASPQY